MFITLEGPEGAGKSTQLGMLAAWLESRGHAPIVTRNPGGTAIGSEIRRVLLSPEFTGMAPLTELMLYAADRAQHVAEVVRPALAAGRIVLCDRFSDSTFAYQGHGRGLDLGLLRTLDGMATGGLRPDLTFLLDLPVEQGLARVRASRSVDRLEGEALGFHTRLRAGYLALAAAEPARIHVVDASDSAQAIAEQLRARLSELRPDLSSQGANSAFGT